MPDDNRLLKTPSAYLPWVISLGLLMETIDTTIVNTAIPSMALSLHTSPLSLKISITTYLLTLAAFIPVSGYIANRYGTRRIFTLAMAVFLLGSMICGLSHHLTALIIGRLIQGIGGSMMTPVARLILLKTFSHTEFVTAYSHLVLIGQLGPAIGPVIGGLLTTFLDWRFVFFVNLPVGLVALILNICLVKNEKEDRITPFDATGFVLFGIAAALITFSLSLLTEEASDASIGLPMLLAGIALSILYYFHAKRTPYPSLDLNLFKIDTFRIAVLGGFLMRISVGGIPFLLPLLFQINFRLTAFQSGLLLLPYGLATAAMKPLIKPCLKRFGFKKIMLVNPLLISVVIFSMTAINAHSHLTFIVGMVFLLGLVCSLQASYMNILNYVDIDTELASKATSLSSVVQQLAISFGVCATAGLLVLNKHVIHQHFIDITAFRCTFAVLAGIALIPLILFKSLPENIPV